LAKTCHLGRKCDREDDEFLDDFPHKTLLSTVPIPVSAQKRCIQNFGSVVQIWRNEEKPSYVWVIPCNNHMKYPVYL
jgi:hypothetical protein